MFYNLQKHYIKSAWYIDKKKLEFKKNVFYNIFFKLNNFLFDFQRKLGRVLNCKVFISEGG